ncbi:MAG TPA: carboxymuconolactone decarboxylase family protein [Candidatus Competibacteraceae bacterium]|nr:carboxymuconolactone decarboxylase family protein [Candidatus Competibacteraceae bacterium]
MTSKPALPELYQRLRDQHRKFFDAAEALGQVAKAAGPLDTKTAQLLQLTAAAAIRSEGAVHSHVRRALAAGATPEEIRHALILVTSTIGFPNVIAALSWADDVIAEKGE